MALTLPYKLRMRAHEGAPEAGLSLLYAGHGFTVEAAGRIVKVPLRNGATAWIAGNVDAVRSSDGSWQSPVEFRNVEIDPANPAAAADRLEGRFILLVVGPGDRCWIGADRQGRADIYVADDKSVMASDLSLFPAPAAQGFDQPALAHTLVAYGCRPPKCHTVYAGVHRLGVGESATWSAGRMQTFAETFQPIASRHLESRSLNEYADRLLDAVRVRGSQNGNVVLLSSGWDSTAILACLVHIFGKQKVRAVIGRMRYAERTGVINQFEIDRAKAVADYFGVPLEIAEFDYRRDGTALFDAVRPLFLEHNIASITGVNHYVLARHVAATTNGDEAVFAGEISDGAHNLGFSQFVSIFHPTQGFREYADKMHSYLFGPTFWAQLLDGSHETDAVYSILRARLGSTVLDPLAATGAERTRQLLASLYLSGNRFPLCSLKNTKLLTEAGAAQYRDTLGTRYLSEAAGRMTSDTLYSWYLHLYNSFHWQGSTVATLALTGESLGLRMALPFWDSRLQETLMALPEDAGRGLDLHPTKYPLKWTLQNRLDYPFHLQVGPHSYLYDVDPSFSHSAELMYGSSFAPVFTGALRKYPHRQILDPALFDVPYLDGVVERYVAGTEVRGGELTDLMALALTASVGWFGQ